MARILIGWDLGGGLGHIVNLVMVGKALAARGHEPVLAVRDPVAVWNMTRDSGLRVVAAPASRVRMSLPAGGAFRARSLADILGVHGMANPDVLEPQVRAWRDLIDLVDPALVIAEFAPTLCLAAEGRVPAISFGIGFTVPCLAPDGSFPVLNPAGTALLPTDALVGSVASVLGRMGAAVPANPLAALLGDVQLNVATDLVDPYREVRPPGSPGPLWRLPAEAVPLPASPFCLVYLPAEHPGIREIVAGLSGLRIPGVAFVRGADQALRTELERCGLEVSDRPFDIEALLPRVSVVFHHAGAGLVERCLAWGRPQVVSPQVLEQELIGNALLRLGVARAVLDPVAARQVGVTLSEVAGSATMQAAAADVAADLRARYRRAGMEAFVAACETRLSRSGT